MLRIYSCNESTGPLHFYSSRLQRGVNEKLLPKNPILYIVRVHDSTCFVKKILQGYHGILTVTKAFLRSTRGVKLHSYGLLRAINGGLAESPWRAKIFTLHALCAQSAYHAYRVYKKFMWHSDIRKDSERSPGKLNRLIIASILQLYTLLERANVAIYT